jgi:hypothetical protein
VNLQVTFVGPTNKEGKELEFCFDFVMLMNIIEETRNFGYFLKTFAHKRQTKFEVLNRISTKNEHLKIKNNRIYVKIICEIHKIKKHKAFTHLREPNA